MFPFETILNTVVCLCWYPHGFEHNWVYHIVSAQKSHRVILKMSTVLSLFTYPSTAESVIY